MDRTAVDDALPSYGENHSLKAVTFTQDAAPAHGPHSTQDNTDDADDIDNELNIIDIATAAEGTAPTSSRHVATGDILMAMTSA